MNLDKSYIKIGSAKDIKDFKERMIYRFFEMLPGLLTWVTLLSIFLFSWQRPVWVAFFIIIFDVYWVCKTFYFSFHLKTSYAKTQDNMQTDWLEKLNELKASRDWRDIYHLIIFPLYKEELDVIEPTFTALFNTHHPKDKMIVVLSVEERAGESAKKVAEAIEKKFGDKFFKFLLTTHSDLPGELKGKGANDTWAAKEAKEKIIDVLKIPYENIIVSVFDVDTQVMPHYFSCLTYNFLICSNSERSSFQPIAFYNNNIWDAPAFSRVIATSGTFWQMMQQERPEKLVTFSSHSMSFKALVELDYWSVKNVSEDSRIFWQALLHYDGDYQTVPIHYPVSMDANLGANLGQTVINVYKQQRRWAWGSENIAFVLYGFLKNKKIPLGKKLLFSFHLLEGFWSWSTNALIVFLLGWLPLFLGGPNFNLSILSYNLPRLTRDLMILATFGAIMSTVYSTRLLPPRPARYGNWKYLSMIFQWCLLPLTILSFGSLPAIDAQTRLMLGKYMGFWVTEKHRKRAVDKMNNE